MATVGPKQGGLWLWRKQATAQIITALLPAARPAPLPLERPLHVGYLRFDRRVGEVLLQTPLFHAHKAARPQDRLTAIVHPGMVRLLKNQPHLDAVVPFAWRGFPLTSEARGLLASLRALELDVLVDCSDPTIFSVGHVMAARLARAPFRVGFNRGPAASHFTHPVDVQLPVHEASARASLLLPFGVQAPPTLLFAPHPKAPTLFNGRDVAAWMRSEPGKHAMVCPGGRLAWRRGGADHFAAMSTALMDLGRTVWLAPGPGEDELIAQVLQLAPGANVLPATDLDQLGDLMQAAGVTVCNNSGTMHLAVAVGSRTFALFVHMDPVRWGHHQPQHRMVTLDLADKGGAQALADGVTSWLGAT
jgi:ADP-heptose:LPS heptosyltransferase